MGWTDQVDKVLGQWLPEISQLLVRQVDVVMLDFFEGPFEVEVRLESKSVLRLGLFERRSRGVAELGQVRAVKTIDFLSSIERAASEVDFVLSSNTDHDYPYSTYVLELRKNIRLADG